MNAPNISVLMPVYNSQNFLAKAIGSILDQTYKDFELIVIDDGSTDNSAEIISSFKDERIKLYKMPHTGLVGALNFGISQCKGEYVAVMHSDDIAAPERLKEEYNVIKGKNNLIVGSCYYVIDENDKILFITKVPETSDEIKKKLKVRNVIIHPGLMFNREFVMQHGMYHQVKNAEDYDLWLRLLTVTEFYNVQKPLVYYRKHAGSLSSSLKNKKYTDAQCYFALQKNAKNILADKNKDIYEGIWNVLYKSPAEGRKLVVKNFFNGDVPFLLKLKYLLMSLLGRNIIDYYYYYNPKLKFFYRLNSLLRLKRSKYKIR